MNKRPSVLDYKKYGAQLDKNLVEMALKTPGENQPSIESSQEIEKFNQVPRSTGETIVQGLFSGIRSGMKKADQEKTMKVLEWFQQNAMAAREQNEWHMQREQEREMLAPYATTALELAYSGGQYGDVDNNMRNVWNQLKTNNPDMQGEYMGFIPNSGIINIRTPDGNIMPYNVGQYVGEDTLKRVQTGYLQKQALGVQQQNADSYGRSAQSNVDYHNAQIDNMPKVQAVREKEAETAERNSQTRLEALGVKSVKEIVPRMDAAYETQEKAQRVLEDIEKYPHVFSSALYNSIDTSGNASSINLAYQNSLPKKERDAYMRINKNLTSLLLSNVESLGQRNNMTLDKWIREGNPNLNFSAENAKILIGDVLKRAKRAESLYRGFLNGPATERIGNVYDQNSSHSTPTQTMGQPQAAPATPQGMSQGIQNSDPNTITMRSPNGKVGKIPLSKSEEAIRQGFVVIE